MRRIHHITVAVLVLDALIGAYYIPKALFRPEHFPLPLTVATAAFVLLGGVRAIQRFGPGRASGGLLLAFLASWVCGVAPVLFPIGWILGGCLLPPSLLAWRGARRVGLGLVRLLAMAGLAFAAWEPEMGPWTAGGGPVPAAVEGALGQGAHVYVLRSLYTHHGISCGDGTVIHFVRGHLGLTLQRTTLARFARGGLVKTQLYADAFQPEYTVQLAQRCLGESSFDLVFHNCEHFSTWCKTGSEASRQIEVTGRAILTGLGLLLLWPLGRWVSSWLGARRRLGAMVISIRMRGESPPLSIRRMGDSKLRMLGVVRAAAVL